MMLARDCKLSQLCWESGALNIIPFLQLMNEYILYIYLHLTTSIQSEPIDSFIVRYCSLSIMSVSAVVVSTLFCSSSISFDDSISQPLGG